MFSFYCRAVFVLDGFQERNFACLFIRPNNTFEYKFSSKQSEGDYLDMNVSWSTYKITYYSNGWNVYDYGSSWQLNYLNARYYYVAF